MTDRSGDMGGSLGKRIVEFQRSVLTPAAECERYYDEVHTVWAMRVMREVPGLVSYETNETVAQRDLLGGFSLIPDHWRFAILRLRGDAPLFTATQARAIAHDHTRFLRELRSFDVTETLLFEEPGRALAAAKFVLVLDRPEQLAAEEAAMAFETLGDELAGHLGSAYGARRLIGNRVLRERGSAPDREPGQRPTGVEIPTTRVGVLELWFDDRVWGEDLLTAAPVQELLAESAFAPAGVRGYLVSERVSHDRRTMR